MKESAYKKAGVDIEAGDALVDRIKTPVRNTYRPGVMADLGGFGALFDLKQAGYKDPLLVSATDGVGTKLKVAIEAGIHDTVGIDLVAMCVNDILTLGAEPLFFLDYFACGALDVTHAETVIKGIAEGCRQAGCSLVGGETAEMPGMYQRQDYDLAGFAVGAVERDKVLNGQKTVREGDVVLGLASSGPHSNGYSLVRKIISDADLSYDDPAPFASGRSLGEALLTPTKIYIRALMPLLKQENNGGVKALAHITGGGLPGNVERVIPDGLAVRIDAARWELPPVFRWLAEKGNLSGHDMAETFNCGIGLVAVCSAGDAARIRQSLEKAGETVFTIGTVVKHTGGEPVEIVRRDELWLALTN